MTKFDRHHVADLTWDAVGHRLAEGAAAILPIGAGAKEHGLHMPMGTDQRQAAWLADQLASTIDALIWPTVSYGYYPAFVAYAGSATLSETTFVTVVRELVDGLIGFGAAKVCVLDTGISTLPPVARAIAACVDPAKAVHLKIHDGPRYRAVAKELAQQTHGTHADELETSRMLVLAPDAIDMARIAAAPLSRGPMVPGALNPNDASAPNYSPSGSTGEPGLATKEKGEALIAAMLEDLLATVTDNR